MDGLGVPLLPLGSIGGDDLANSHGVTHYIRHQPLQTGNDGWQPGVRLASVLPPGTDDISLRLQWPGNLRRQLIFIIIKNIFIEFKSSWFDPWCVNNLVNIVAP